MLNKSIIHKIENFINDKHLLNSEGHYLVALSGGSDSVALLLILKQLKYNIEAIHCNFHLRGEESNRDEKFCESLCKIHRIPFHRIHFDTVTYASTHKISIEMAARELRYNYFEHLRHDINANAICVAHHSDDSAETFLINLIRGTGISGLQGISAKNGYIVRPLLCISRNDILKYLEIEKQNFVTDSTNLIDDVVRNKIRLDVMPLLRSINPAASLNIAYTAQRVTQAVHVFEDAMLKSVDYVMDKDGVVNLKKLNSQISPEYTLFYILRKYNFSSAQIENIYSSLPIANTGKRWSSNTHEIAIDRNNLVIAEKSNIENKSLRIPEEGNYIWNNGLEFSFKHNVINNYFTISKQSSVITIDADAVKYPLTIRHIKNGDKFIPFGMKGCKLINDFLSDNKLSIIDKQRQLIIEDAEGKIIWIVGLRTDNRVRILPESINYLQISIRNKKTDL